MQFDSILGTILGLTFGLLLGVRLSRTIATRLANQQEFRLACRNFRQTFIPEIQRIESLQYKSGITEQHIIAVLRDSAVKHKEAMIEFRYILKSFQPHQITAFQNIWLQYSCEDHKEKGLLPYYSYSLTSPDNPQPEFSDIKKNALDKIDELLNFADYKTK